MGNSSWLAFPQVRFQLEQTREGLQRQLAATDGQMHVLRARLDDSQAEQQVWTPPFFHFSNKHQKHDLYVRHTSLAMSDANFAAPEGAACRYMRHNKVQEIAMEVFKRDLRLSPAVTSSTLNLHLVCLKGH